MADTEKQAEVKPDTPPYSGFTPARRRFILGLVSTAGFLGPLAGGIYLPALPVLEQDFRVSSTAINATVSVFMLLCAFAALFWSSFSDWKGRRPLYLIALAIYLASNMLLAALPANFGALVFLRMVQAFGCSSVITLGAGTVADITEPAKRGFAMSIFLLGPNLGPTIGPVLGGVITGQASWRWTFGFLAIAVGATWLTILFAFPETLRFRVGNGAMYANAPFLIIPPRLVSPLAPEDQRGPAPPKPSLRTFFRLLRYPPITVAAFYTALLFANYFAIAVGLSDVLVRRYGWSVTAVGGGYLALGAAIVSGSMLAGRFSDWRRARAVARKGPDGKVDPERRLVDQVWSAVVCVAGTVMYGWCVEKGVHPAVVLVATALVGLGMSSVLVVTFAFLTESAPQASAGAMALENMMRNPAAAITAVITPPLVARMGYGWYFTSFAIVVGVVFSSGALALATYGPEWRKTRAIPPPAPAPAPAPVPEAAPTPSVKSADDSSKADEKTGDDSSREGEKVSEP